MSNRRTRRHTRVMMSRRSCLFQPKGKLHWKRKWSYPDGMVVTRDTLALVRFRGLLGGKNINKGQKKKSWGPTMTWPLGKIMVHPTSTAGSGRSQPWTCCSFGKLGCVVRTNKCQVRVIVRRCDQCGTLFMGRASQIEHKAWYHNRRYAGMSNRF